MHIFYQLWVQDFSCPKENSFWRSDPNIHFLFSIPGMLFCILICTLQYPLCNVMLKYLSHVALITFNIYADLWETRMKASTVCMPGFVPTVHKSLYIVNTLHKGSFWWTRNETSEQNHGCQIKRDPLFTISSSFIFWHYLFPSYLSKAQGIKIYIFFVFYP